jgi:hypothetical protein
MEQQGYLDVGKKLLSIAVSKCMIILEEDGTDLPGGLMRLIRHLSPALSSLSVWFVKIFNTSVDRPLGAADKLEITFWALLSLLVSCSWRIWTDEKTLATAAIAKGKISKILLNSERLVAICLLAACLLLAGKGAKSYANSWVVLPIYVLYWAFPFYLAGGDLADALFKKAIGSALGVKLPYRSYDMP